MLIPLYLAGLLLLYIPFLARTQASPSTQIPSRWGHASSYLPSPPTLVIHGGKTDPDSAYSYSSAPNVGSTLFLPLNATFIAQSAPVTEIKSPSGPALAWHTLSQFAYSNGTWQILSFGGDSGTSQPSQTSNNSVWLDNFDLQNYSSLQYVNQPESWGSQPSNRIYHSAVTGIDDKVYITGGLKDDGSNTAFADVYLFDSSHSYFTPLPSLPDCHYHHESILLGNGSILVLGGAFTSQITSNVDVHPYTNFRRLDLSSNSASGWVEVAVTGDAPQGRRGATATATGDGDKVILLGGASSDLQTVYDEIWTLDLNTLTWEKEKVAEAGTGPGARFDHSAIAVDENQIIVFGGYTQTGPADGGIYIYNTVSNSWVSNFTVSAGFNSTAKKSDSEVASSTVATGSAMAKIPCTLSSSGTMVDLVSSCVLSENSDSSSQSNALAVPSSTIAINSGDSGAYSHSLTVPLVIGLTIGSVGLAGALLAVCMWRARRRLTRRKAYGDPSYASSPRSRTFNPIRRHSPVEEEGPKLIDEMMDEKGTNVHKEMENPRTEAGTLSAVIAFRLEVGAVGRGFSSISSRIRGSRWDSRPYSELTDYSPNDAQAMPHPPAPARQMGIGIHLLGPPLRRDKSLYYSPSNSTAHVTSVAQDNRIGIFCDEDSTRSEHHRRDPVHFEELPGTKECGVLRSHAGKWYSANSNNGAEEKEVGAPSQLPSQTEAVPMPQISITKANKYGSYCSPYESLQYRLPNFRPSEPLEFPGVTNAFPIPGYGSLRSNPHSAHIHESLTSRHSDDMDESGQDVHVAIENQPSPTIQNPLHRKGSIFKRMAEASASVLLGRRPSQASGRLSMNQLEIRDPAPQPTLWPVLSQVQLCSVGIATPSLVAHENRQHPPVSWRDNVSQGLLPNDSYGPSISSLKSFRSMRDMIIVQKEETQDNIETFRIIDEDDSGGSPEPKAAGLTTHLQRRESNENMCTPKEDHGEIDGFTCKQEPSREGWEATILMDSLAFEPRVLDLSLKAIVDPGAFTDSSAILKTAGLLDTESVAETESGLSDSLSHGSDKNSSLEEAASGTPQTDPSIFSHSPGETKPPHEHVTPLSAESSFDFCATSAGKARRRPVREVVNSINKRGDNTPMGLLAPRSFYSPAPGSSSGGMKVHSGPISKSTMSSDDADPSGICNPFVTSESEYVSQSMRPTSTSPTFKGPIAPHDTAIIPKQRETPVGQVKTKTMWEMVKREETLRIANPDAASVSESKKPLPDFHG